MPQTFSLLITENSVALINVAINFGYNYFSLVIYSFKIFFVKFFFQHFFQIFLYKLGKKKFFFKFFLQKFFPFFQNFFSKFVFWGLYSRCSPVYRDETESMYLCYEKSNIAGATRNKYITYRTDIGRSAVYVSCLHKTFFFKVLILYDSENVKNLILQVCVFAVLY